jgi:hypothetical protein
METRKPRLISKEAFLAQGLILGTVLFFGISKHSELRESSRSKPTEAQLMQAFAACPSIAETIRDGGYFEYNSSLKGAARDCKEKKAAEIEPAKQQSIARRFLDESKVKNVTEK